MDPSTSVPIGMHTFSDELVCDGYGPFIAPIFHCQEMEGGYIFYYKTCKKCKLSCWRGPFIQMVHLLAMLKRTIMLHVFCLV